jgi:hypothetical protein
MMNPIHCVFISASRMHCVISSFHRITYWLLECSVAISRLKFVLHLAWLGELESQQHMVCSRTWMSCDSDGWDSSGFKMPRPQAQGPGSAPWQPAARAGALRHANGLLCRPVRRQLDSSRHCSGRALDLHRLKGHCATLTRWLAGALKIISSSYKCGWRHWQSSSRVTVCQELECTVLCNLSFHFS